MKINATKLKLLLDSDTISELSKQLNKEKAPHTRKYVTWSETTVSSRLCKIIIYMREVEDAIGIDNLHVKIMKGNSKAKLFWTISLLPVVDCYNCEQCMFYCYDLRNVLWQESVWKQRVINSLIHRHDPKRFWREVTMEIIRVKAYHVRFNVGGDFTSYDMNRVEELKAIFPNTTFFLFTKNVIGLNNSKLKANRNLYGVISMDGFENSNDDTFDTLYQLAKDRGFNLSSICYAGETTAVEKWAMHRGITMIYCNNCCDDCVIEKRRCMAHHKEPYLILMPAH